MEALKPKIGAIRLDVIIRDGEGVEVYGIPWTIGPHGPFYTQVPKSEFNADAVEARILQEAQPFIDLMARLG